MKRFLIMIAVLGLIAGGAATAKAEQRFSPRRTVAASYHGAQMLYEYRSCDSSGGVGCVALETRAGERSLTAKVTDAHGQPVSVWVVDASETMEGFDGADAVYGSFCGETTEPIRFEPGAELELWIGGEWWPTWWIVPEIGCFPGHATTGTVQISLSR